MTKERIFGLSLGAEGDPAVVVIFDYRYEMAAQIPDYWARFGSRPVLIIVLRSWEVRASDNWTVWRNKIDAHQRKHPAHRLVFSLNSPNDPEVMRSEGMEAFYCSHNAFVDEVVYRPADGVQSGEAREFDAIYDARFAKYKRHQLATKVRRLALIHYYAQAGHTTGWALLVRWWMRHANILNRRQSWPHPLRPVPMPRAQVAAAYGRAHVGLALSAVEGAMLASIQYLLCGLPVVTTPSRGGRDVFFDDQNSITVEPEARAVAAGVREMIARRVDPWAIRARALERVAEHRERFRAYVAEYQTKLGVPPERRIGGDWGRRAGEVFTTALR